MQNMKTKAANLLFTSLRGRVVSWFCHINHFSISPVPRDYAHFTLHSPNLGTMETGGRQSPEIRVVNQTEPNKRRMSFLSSRGEVFEREEERVHTIFLLQGTRTNYKYQQIGSGMLYC